jgi:hypothetical protein
LLKKPALKAAIKKGMEPERDTRYRETRALLAEAKLELTEIQHRLGQLQAMNKVQI